MTTTVRPISIRSVPSNPPLNGAAGARLQRAIPAETGSFNPRPVAVRAVNATDACRPLVQRSTAAAFPRPRASAYAKTVRALSP